MCSAREWLVAKRFCCKVTDDCFCIAVIMTDDLILPIATSSYMHMGHSSLPPDFSYFHLSPFTPLSVFTCCLHRSFSCNRDRCLFTTFFMPLHTPVFLSFSQDFLVMAFFHDSLFLHGSFVLYFSPLSEFFPRRFSFSLHYFTFSFTAFS